MSYYFHLMRNSINSNNRGITPNPPQLLRTPGTTMGNMPSQPVWTNHRFLGWFDTSGPTGGNQLTSTARVPDRNTTYYARWEATVTFDADGGLVRSDNGQWVGSFERRVVVGARTTLPTVLSPSAFGNNSANGLNNNISNAELDEIFRNIDNSEANFEASSTIISGWFGLLGILLGQPNDEIPVHESHLLVARWTPQRHVDVRGPRVIECFGRNGYVDISGLGDQDIIACVGMNLPIVPIWDFVHITGNDFAIKNDTTGQYLTETNGNLRHEARLSGTGTNYSNRQRWRLHEMPDGSFRIQNLSNTSLYIQEGGIIPPPHFGNSTGLTLATLNTNHNRQRWWVGNVWRSYSNFVGFYPGIVNIYTRPIGEQPDGFNFEQRMSVARSTWRDALDVAFVNTINTENSHIMAYGGRRHDIIRHINWPFVPEHTLGTTFPPRAGEHAVQSGTIYAGGADRTVMKFIGTGTLGTRIAVYTDNSQSQQNDIGLATFAAIHELGHALGYFGHSTSSGDLMYRFPSFFPREELRSAEREHLRQIYRMFRD